MTNISTHPNSWFVSGPSKYPRTVDTLPPELVEQARKLAIGARIKDARERSKWRQQAVADKLGIGLRAYQKLEKEGTSHFERCEELAEILELEGVTADYLWDGTPEQPASPLDALSAPTSAADLADLRDQLDRLERAVGLLLADRGLEQVAPPSEQERQRHSG